MTTKCSKSLELQSISEDTLIEYKYSDFPKSIKGKKGFLASLEKIEETFLDFHYHYNLILEIDHTKRTLHIVSLDENITDCFFDSEIPSENFGHR